MQTVFSPCAQERFCSSRGTRPPRLCPLSKDPGQVQGESLLLVPRISPHSEFHCGSVAIPGSREDFGVNGSRSCPSFRAFSRNSSGGLALQGWAEEFSRSCYSQDGVVAGRDSKAKIQPLQLLRLNHLLNYAGKCPRNHNLHWFSSPLPETRVNCARGNHS